MNKLFKLLFSFIILLNGICVYAYDLTTAASPEIRQGTFIKVMVPIEFSTLTSDIGDEILFLNTSDLYVYETNAIPKNSKIYGEVEDIKEPVMGRDGAIKILINKIITPQRKVYKCVGHIYSENDNYLGGAETTATYYRKVPHFSYRLKPYLQAAPLKVLEMGKHTVIKPGEELFIIFDDDVKIK